jgi:hypothetical protein
MIKIGPIEIGDIDFAGDFEFSMGDCNCGVEQYTYLNSKEAQRIIIFLTEQLKQNKK